MEKFDMANLAEMIINSSDGDSEKILENISTIASTTIASVIVLKEREIRKTEDFTEYYHQLLMEDYLYRFNEKVNKLVRTCIGTKLEEFIGKINEEN